VPPPEPAEADGEGVALADGVAEGLGVADGLTVGVGVGVGVGVDAAPIAKVFELTDRGPSPIAFMALTWIV
jgi:hypothetical protein